MAGREKCGGGTPGVGAGDSASRRSREAGGAQLEAEAGRRSMADAVWK